jgi:hypothetical protein
MDALRYALSDETTHFYLNGKNMKSLFTYFVMFPAALVGCLYGAMKYQEYKASKEPVVFEKPDVKKKWNSEKVMYSDISQISIHGNGRTNVVFWYMDGKELKEKRFIDYNSKANSLRIICDVPEKEKNWASDEILTLQEGEEITNFVRHDYEIHVHNPNEIAK